MSTASTSTTQTATIDGVTLADRPDGELLPARAFLSQPLFEAELEHVFERSWLHVADLAELASAGDYVSAQIGRVPVIVMRGHDGELRGFLNACRHRGAALVDGTGNCGAQIRCPYHAWSYRTDGTLAGVPYREEFDCRVDGMNLVPIRVAACGPMVFGCLDDRAPAFEDWAGDLPTALARAGAHRMVPSFRFTYDVPVNWKLYVENGLDGYHIQFVHDVLAGIVARPGEATHTFEAWSSYTLAPVAAEMLAMVSAASGAAPPVDGEPPRIRFGNVLPNLIPVLTPGDFSYLRIDPLAVDRIRLIGRSFDLDDAAARALRGFRSQAFDRTNQQDIAVVTRVQRGLAAGRHLPPGVHSRTLECRVGHFERMLLRELRAGLDAAAR
jgi:choline monooxygenase